MSGTAPAHAPAPPPGHAVAARRRRTVATVALALVVATVVALLLAQSAGAVHLPLLGGTGGQPPGTGPATHPGAARATDAGQPTPANRSSSVTSTPPTRLRASR